jgi:hypothetical protein
METTRLRLAAYVLHLLVFATVGLDFCYTHEEEHLRSVADRGQLRADCRQPEFEWHGPHVKRRPAASRKPFVYMTQVPKTYDLCVLYENESRAPALYAVYGNFMRKQRRFECCGSFRLSSDI